MKKRALLYMTNNEGVVGFASKLLEQGFEILSYGKTFDVLKDADIETINFSEFSHLTKPNGMPELLEHSLIYGITAQRFDMNQVSFIREREIEPIDIVAVNFETFDSLKNIATQKETDLLSLIDFEKIIFLSMAVKNYADVAVLVSSKDYDCVLEEITQMGEVSLETRTNLASYAVSYISNYIALLNSYLSKKSTGTFYPEYFTLTFEKEKELTNGQNSYQSATFYKDSGLDKNVFEVFGNNSEGYTQIADISFAYNIIKDIKQPTAIAVKREIISGAGTGTDTYDACSKAFKAEGVNMAGSALFVNSVIDRKSAYEIIKFSFETVVAPEIDEEAISVLSGKEGLKVIVYNGEFSGTYSEIFNLKQIFGGVVVESADLKPLNTNELLCVTEKAPQENEMDDLIFGFNCVKGSKSSAVALVKNGQLHGIGQGQLDVLKAFKTALDSAGTQVKGCVLATDSSVLSPDFIENISALGINAIVQSGDTANIQDIVNLCNEKEISMLVTNTTYYKN